jgi:NAD(P)-dependent dehydrogenase (short-subunit alcohol dehydrogenase family)
MKRLEGKVAIVVGAGQSPGEGIGNGRATALLFAREGAKVLAAFDRITAINLRSVVMACKHVLPIMRRQMSGAIVNISSVAAISDYPFVTYKVTKAAMIAYTQQIAIQNAEFGIRANVILPGLMDTPMAVDTRARTSNRSRAQVAAERDAKVPLRHKMGTGWDVAKAALFLASDDAAFVTGVSLPVDGGQSIKIG